MAHEKETAKNTRKAYSADWNHFARWSRLTGSNPLVASPQVIALYLGDLALEDQHSPVLSVSTIERRLAGLIWNFAQRGVVVDRNDPQIADTLAGLRRRHARPPLQKQKLLPEEITAMVSTLTSDLRGLRDQAMLLLGYAGGLGRSEIVGLDANTGDAPECRGWVDVMKDGVLITCATKAGWREIEVGRESSGHPCPVNALERWVHFAKIDSGPLFVRTSRDGKRTLDVRLSDKHVARLIKTTVFKSGIRADIPEAERLALFSGQSLQRKSNP